METVDLAIRGSYLVYVYVVLLEISIVYLQRPNLYRLLQEQDRTSSSALTSYPVITGNIGNALNWFSWLLSAFVAKEFGIAQGVLFFILGVGTSISANILTPRLPRIDQIGHVISIPATIILTRAVLLAAGIQTII